MNEQKYLFIDRIALTNENCSVAQGCNRLIIVSSFTNFQKKK